MNPNMTLSTPPISPLVTTLKKQHQPDNPITPLPRNSNLYLNQHLQPNNDNSSTPSLFTSLSTSSLAHKAMSVMSSASSYQYSSTFGNDPLDDSEEGAGGEASIHSAPASPEDYDALTKRDLASVLDSHRTLLAAAQVYREQLSRLASASAEFGIALESVAKHKATMEAGEGLLSAGGLQFLISNHHQLLADTMHKTFEIPLAEHIEEHQSTIKESQENYDTALQMISKNIRQKEADNLQQAKKGQRDLRQYRRTLKELTRQVDELDYIKTTFNQRMQDIEQHYHQGILHQTGWLVRAQVDIYELLASKGLGDSILEQMIQQHPDPFSSYATVNDLGPANDLFTVLPSSSLIDPLPTSPSLPDDNHNTATSPYNADNEDQAQVQDTIPTYFDSHLHSATPFIYKRPSTDSFHRHIQQSSSSTPSESNTICTDKKGGSIHASQINKTKKGTQPKHRSHTKTLAISCSSDSNSSIGSSSDEHSSTETPWNDIQYTKDIPTHD